MTATVRDKVDQMEDTILRQKQFVSAFTHELKTPMTTIAGLSTGFWTARSRPINRIII